MQMLTVSVIRHNHAVDRLISQISDGLRECISLSEGFEGQRTLFARAKQTERVLNAALKMISQNKMQLWMIDDAAIADSDNGR